MEDTDIIKVIEYDLNKDPHVWITGADIFNMMSNEMHLRVMDFIKDRSAKYTESEALELLELNNSFHYKVGLYHSINPIGHTDIIKDMNLALLEKKDVEDGLIETIHSIKTMCILDVEAEWESTKDKTLSNATKRNVEVELRLSGDAEYVMRVDQQTSLHREIRRDQIELEFQQREFQRQMRE